MATDANGRTLAVNDSVRTSKGDGRITAIDGSTVTVLLDADNTSISIAGSLVTYTSDESMLTLREARAAVPNVYTALATLPAAVDGDAATPTLRTLGYTATQSPPGNVFGRVFPTAATRTALAAAISSLGANKGTVHVLNSTTIDAAVTVPANVALKVEPGVLLTKSGSGAITINGPFEAPATQIFTSFAAGDVKFGAGYVNEIRPEWWGAKADCTGGADGTDCTLAMQAAVAAITSTDFRAPTIVLGPGAYRITDALVCSNAASGYWLRLGVHIRGSGKSNTVIVVDADNATDGLVYSHTTQFGSGGSLRGLTVQGADTSGNTKVRSAIVVRNWSTFTAEDVGARSADSRCLDLSGSMFTTFRNCGFYGCNDIAAQVGIEREKNLIGGSADFSATYWATYNNVAAAPTITRAQADPDSGTNAIKLAFPGIGGAGQQSGYQDFLLPTTVQRPAEVTFSVYLKVPTGTGTVYIFFADNANQNRAPAYTECALTTAWQRFEVTDTLAKNGMWAPAIGQDASRGMPSSQAAVDVLCYHPQVEGGDAATAFELPATVYTGTTALFDVCSFEVAAHQGCLVAHHQLDAAFRFCTFEGNGAGTDTVTGHGLEVWDGVVAIEHPYFEANTAKDFYADDPIGLGFTGPRVTVTDPQLYFGWGFVTSRGGLYFGGVRASSLVGGYFAPNYFTHPVVVSSSAELEIRAFPDPVPGDSNPEPQYETSYDSVVLGARVIEASVGPEGTQITNGREVYCQLADEHGTHITEEIEVLIESNAETDGQGDLSAANLTPQGTIRFTDNNAAGSNFQAMTTTAAGEFSFGVVDTGAEDVIVRISADGYPTRVLVLAFT